MKSIFLYGIWTQFPEGKRYGELKGYSFDDVIAAHCKRQEIEPSQIISVDVIMSLYPWIYCEKVLDHE